MSIPLANILQPIIDLAHGFLTFLHDDVGVGYGLSIVLLTFTTRFLILPLSIKQIRSMRALGAISPQIKVIQERYKDDKQRLQREMMNVYQENDVNPFASCLPLLLQLPIFFALYSLLKSNAFQDDLRAAGDPGFLFIHALDAKATGAVLIGLLGLYATTSIVAGLIMTGPQTTGQQRMLAMGLPLAFTPVMAGFPAGLLVYWISTNVWTMGQQAVVKVFFPPDAVPTPEEVAAAKPPPLPPRKRKRRR